MTARMDGKVALVTGAARGMGAATAKLFAKEGAKVICTDVLEELGHKVVSEINNDGGQAVFVRLDVSSAVEWQSAVDKAVSTFGSLTTLVNNAGVVHPAGLEAETIEGWNKIIAINQTGVFLGMKTAMPELLKSGNAAIVNISSVGAFRGEMEVFAYHASKGAVRIMSKAAAVEYVRRGVRVNTIFPGGIDTPVNDTLTPEQKQGFAEKMPRGAWGEAEDIAYGVLYLASDEAKYVTGAELIIDGGFSA